LRRTQKRIVTKIHGQPKENGLTTLEKELIAIAASIPCTLGGRNHGHAGVIAVTAKYLLMTGGTAFVIPANPGIYPAGLQANAKAGTWAREEAIHKELVAQYEIFKGVKQGLKDIIQEVVETDYLLEIEDKTLGFLNQMPGQMIEHLRNRGGALDFAEPKHYCQKETQNGTWAKSHNSTSTQLRKQWEDSPELVSTPTSTSAGTWPYFISRNFDAAPSVNGKQNLQQTKHGLTSKTSSQLSMQNRTSKTNSQQSNSRQMQLKNKLRWQKSLSTHSLKTTRAKWKH
jgi:hypothetical protein